MLVCGRHGLAVLVYLVAVMDMICGRQWCGHHGLWPSWYRPISKQWYKIWRWKLCNERITFVTKTTSHVVWDLRLLVILNCLKHD